MAPKDEFKYDWWSFHFNHIDEDNAKNTDLYFACLNGEVDDVSSCDGNYDFISSYVESTHDIDIENGFKVFDNMFYYEVVDVD